MRRGGRLLAVFVAALGWSAVAAVLADWSGFTASPAPVAAAMSVPDDPCGLRQFLPVGTGARCELPLPRRGGAPLVVELAQTWDSTAPAVLVQHLRVREQDAAAPLVDVQTRSTATSTPLRFQRLAVVPIGGDAAHLLYVVGNCGGLGCGQNDVVVSRWDGTRQEELLRRRVGPLADIAVGDGRITVFDGTGRGVGRQRSERMLRTYVWIGGVYAQVAHEPVPTIPPP